MKKLLALLLVLMLLQSVAFAENFIGLGTGELRFPGVSTSTGSLPSIDEALALGGNKPVQVDCPIPAVDYYAMTDVDFPDIKMILLQRVCPEKIFKGYDSGYPNNYQESLPDDFVGEDNGTIQTWLRLDLMAELPESVRASSVEDANFLYIVEDQYCWMGTMQVTDFNGDADEPDIEFETLEELEAYQRAHPKKISAITYYPKFAHEIYAYLYFPETGETCFSSYDCVNPKSFARNPEADALYTEMEDLDDLIQLIEASPEAFSETSFLTIMDDFDNIPESKINFWVQCLNAQEYHSMTASMNDYCWTIANEIVALDPEQSHQTSLKIAIENQDKAFFSGLVNAYDYLGFDREMEIIGANKEYMAELPDDAFSKAFDELFSAFEE